MPTPVTEWQLTAARRMRSRPAIWVQPVGQVRKRYQANHELCVDFGINHTEQGADMDRTFWIAASALATWVLLGAAAIV